MDATSQGNKAVRAGPLLGAKGSVSIHAYIDHSIIAVIFNNQVIMKPLVDCMEALWWC